MSAVPPPTGRGKRAHFVRRPGECRSVAMLQTVRPWNDFYHRALRMRWPWLVFAIVCTYLLANAGFALLYLLDGNAIGGARAGSFADAFFFSVQTMGTIGYGKLVPISLYANLLVTLETVFGMLSLALATGLLFARVSIPSAKILFSQRAVVFDYQGQPTLSFRIANERQNQIIQAEVTATLIRTECSSEGVLMRRLHSLTLVRSTTPIFELTFSALHVIDAASPLAGATPDSLATAQSELIVTVTGLDETMGQTIHARYSYLWDEIDWQHRFVDIFQREDGVAVAVDMQHFHATEPVPGSSATPRTPASAT